MPKTKRTVTLTTFYPGDGEPLRVHECRSMRDARALVAESVRLTPGASVEWEDGALGVRRGAGRIRVPGSPAIGFEITHVN